MRPKGIMRRWASLGAWLLAIVLVLAMCASAQATSGEATSLATPPLEPVHYQVDAYYPPYTFENDRFLYGFDPYLTNIIFTSDKYKLIYSTDTWDNVYRRLVNGEIDLAGIIAVTEERKKEVLFTDPLFNSYVGLYTERDHAPITLDDLPALRVGVGKGYYTESILRNTLNMTSYHAYADIGEALNDLLDGKIDVIFENQQYMDNILIQRSLKGSIVAQVTNLYPRPHAYAVSKQKPALVAYMNERIRKLKQSGFFEEIYLKYFYAHSDGYVSEQNQRTLILRYRRHSGGDGSFHADAAHYPQTAPEPEREHCQNRSGQRGAGTRQCGVDRSIRRNPRHRLYERRNRAAQQKRLPRGCARHDRFRPIREVWHSVP